MTAFKRHHCSARIRSMCKVASCGERLILADLCFPFVIPAFSSIVLSEFTTKRISP